jgi:hypothetical protein
MGYPNLYVKYGWRPGVHRAGPGFQHPWLAVTQYGTSGHWTRAEAREVCRLARQGVSESALLRATKGGERNG